MSLYLIWCHHQSNIQSGVRTFQSLPRQTFGTLQARLTPFYFSTSTILTSTLLLTHLYFHPSLISAPTVKPHWHSSEEGRQGLLIVAGLVPQLLNLIWFGPQATKVMFERHRLEKLEGKEYNDANVSPFPFELNNLNRADVQPSAAMDQANKQFGFLHSVTAALDLISLGGLIGLGLAVSM
jgi:hypothetical protein